MTEVEAKIVIGAYGIPTPETVFVSTAEETEGAAAKLLQRSSKVAVKLLSKTLTHKSDVGGVKLGLRSRADVTDAVASMSHLGDRFLVERMVEGAVAELIVGVVRDPQFGPTLTVGAGGVLVEMLKDAAVMLLPVTAEEIREKLMSLRVARLLEGFRGKPRGDIRGTIKAILAIADFAERHADRLVELDVNPLFVLPEGRGAIAADALVRMLD